MKTYLVDCDITMSKTMEIEAESEEQARELAKEMIDREPYYYARCADAHVKTEVIDTDEV